MQATRRLRKNEVGAFFSRSKFGLYEYLHGEDNNLKQRAIYGKAFSPKTAELRQEKTEFNGLYSANIGEELD